MNFEKSSAETGEMDGVFARTSPEAYIQGWNWGIDAYCLVPERFILRKAFLVP
jgi:hypothetical protein